MIRAGIPGDEFDLADVHVAAWQRAYSGIFSDEYLGSLDRVRRQEWWGRFLERGELVHVAVIDRIVGFCIAHASRDDDSWGEISAIYVHPDHWGVGHGWRLLRAGEETLRDDGFSRGMLWVLEDNDRARAFYERAGWTRGRPFRLEEIGGTQVTELRYETAL